MTSVIKEGEIVSKLMTKQGSKDLQRAVDNAPVALIEQILCEIEPVLVDILIDQYGNYFCQKLFAKLSCEQQIRLLQTLALVHITEEQKREKTSKKTLKSKFLFVSSDIRGTHAIQSFIDAVFQEPLILKMISETINQDIMKYALNKNANHVLIKFIKLASI